MNLNKVSIIPPDFVIVVSYNISGGDIMKESYSTSEVAKIIGIHPNTVRLYEDLNLITSPKRKANGYRIFTKLHIDQFKIARLAFEVEVLQNGLRKRAVEIVKTCAACEFDKAIELTSQYLDKVQSERQNAEEAIDIVENILSGHKEEYEEISLTRKEAASYLNVTIDTLRNWELNGLLITKRKENGYRIYTYNDIERLKIIYSLRCANYSLSAILRMLNALSNESETNIKDVIDTPKEDDDIITAYDRLLTSLFHAGDNARKIYYLLIKMKEEYTLLC